MEKEEWRKQVKKETQDNINFIMNKRITKLLELIKAEMKLQADMKAKLVDTKIGDKPNYSSYRFEECMKGLWLALIDELEKEI